MLKFFSILFIVLLQTDGIKAQKKEELLKQNAMVIMYELTTNFWGVGFLDGLKKESRHLPLHWTVLSLRVESKDLILQKIKDIKPKLIVLESGYAVRSLLKEIITLNIPVFFSSLMPEQKEELLGSLDRSKFTGVFNRNDVFSKSCHVLNRTMKGNLRKIGIIGGDYEDTVKFSQIAESSLKKDGYQVEAKTAKDYDEWKKWALNLNQKMDAMIVFLPFGLKHKNEEPVDWFEVGWWVKNNINLPTMGVASPLSTPVKRTVSVFVPPEELGRRTSLLIDRYLTGISLGNIPFDQEASLDYAISDFELKRLSLWVPEEFLPFVKLDR